VKAIYIRQHGAVHDLKVSEVPKPSVSGDEVLVKVEASGIMWSLPVET
jgi:NADPH:quinone reductase-like Zn-dependent oxidoreductase